MHTMEELHFVGNCLKGSRPILSFDSAFDKESHLKVIKQLFISTFGVPEGSRKSKPFIDHVMSFTMADGKIWIRVYQINETEAKATTGEDGEAEKASSKSRTTKETDINLVEIGPRFILTPIVCQVSIFLQTRKNNLTDLAGRFLWWPHYLREQGVRLAQPSQI